MSSTVKRMPEMLKKKPQDHSGSCGRQIPVDHHAIAAAARDRYFGSAGVWPDLIHAAFMRLRGQYGSGRLSKAGARRLARKECGK